MAVTFIMMCVMLGIMLAVFATIGYVIYKDAKAMGLNAVMWTVLAVFIPNFIGVIIYLVVRSTTAKKVTCSVCHTKIKEDYNVCPECGNSFMMFCKGCKRPIEAGLKICPYCGEPTNDIVQPTAVKIFPKTNIAKSLGVILAIFLGSIIFIIIGAFGMGSILHKTQYAPNGLSIMNVENNMGNKYSDKFYYKNGASNADFKIDGKLAGILAGEVEVIEGQIVMEITDSTGKTIFSETFTANEAPYAIHINVGNNKETYVAQIKYQKARGSVALQAE